MPGTTTDTAIDLPALCGSVQDLTNPDICGVGVLASYTAAVALVFVHQACFALLDCSSRRSNRTPHGSQLDGTVDRHAQPGTSDTRPYQLRISITASSISLFETAIVLAISWQVAALLSLNSKSSVQTTHDVLLVCLTAYAAIAIALGALCTSFDHIRRHKFRIGSCLLSLLLCAFVTGIAQHLMVKDDFPKEICLPFFNDYKANMRKYFVVLSAVFWAISSIMVAIIFLPTVASRKDTDETVLVRWHPRLLGYLVRSRLYVVMLLEILLLVMVLLVNHHYVPEQVLRAQAGGKLAEGQWSFGQIVGMLIWLPVLAEFMYVYLFGPKEGLEGRLPTPYVVSSQRSNIVGMPLSRLSRRSIGKGFTKIEVSQKGS